MAKIQQKLYLYIYADSHGSDRHYFREQFEPLFERSKRFKKPKIKANPGCEMNQKKVREICERATHVGPLDQVPTLDPD